VCSLRLAYSDGVTSSASWVFRALVVFVAGCGGSAFTAAPSGANDDASATDAASLDAAGSDASADASGDSFCTLHGSQLELCADFDPDTQPLSKQWVVTSAGGGTIGVDASESVSAPSSLVFTSPALASGATAVAVATRSGLSRGAAHLEMDLKLEKVTFPDAKDTQASAAFLAITQGKTYTLVFLLHPTDKAPFGIALVELISPAGQPATANVNEIEPAKIPAVGTWSRMTVRASIAAASWTISVQFDANGAQTFPLAPPAGVGLGDRALVVGLSAKGALSDFAARVDNLTYDPK